MSDLRSSVKKGSSAAAAAAVGPVEAAAAVAGGGAARSGDSFLRPAAAERAAEAFFCSLARSAFFMPVSRIV